MTAMQVRSRPSQPSPAGRSGPAVPRQVAFWLLALVLTVTMLGTTLPTPLYVIYQGRWHFSAALVTVTFAVYAAAVIATLLLAGRASDQAGRRPVLAAALAASALSTVVFILAPDLETLIAARIVSGLSAGLMTGTATATLTELIPASDQPPGVAGGHGGEHGRPGPGPLDRRTVRPVRAAPHDAGVRGLPGRPGGGGPHGAVRPRDGAAAHRPALRFAGLGIPERGRAEFIAAGVAAFAAFALLGLFSSLVPGFVAGPAASGQPRRPGRRRVSAVRGGDRSPRSRVSRFDGRRVVLAGLSLFVAALALIVAALAQSAMALFLAGTVVGGVAVGAIFLGSLATANRLAPPERRGHAISAFFVACYTGLIIPVVGVGVLSQFTGTFPAVLTFSILLAALCLFSIPRFVPVRDLR